MTKKYIISWDLAHYPPHFIKKYYDKVKHFFFGCGDYLKYPQYCISYIGDGGKLYTNFHCPVCGKEQSYG